VCLQAFSPVWDPILHHSTAPRRTWPWAVVVLVVTGAEALYADAAHFGAGPIRLAWFGIVFPGVLLSYLGRRPGAWPTHATGQSFFLLAPHLARSPWCSGHRSHGDRLTGGDLRVLLSGQAGHAAGLSAGLRIVQPRWSGPDLRAVVNWMLAAGVVGLVLAFQTSNALSNAYGVAVTGTFILNTVLFLVVGSCHLAPAGLEAGAGWACCSWLWRWPFFHSQPGQILQGLVPRWSWAC